MQENQFYNVKVRMEGEGVPHPWWISLQCEEVQEGYVCGSGTVYTSAGELLELWHLCNQLYVISY